MTIHDVVQTANEIIANIFTTASIFFPRILWALFLAGTGWIISLILKKMAVKMVSGLDLFFQKKAEQKGLYSAHIKYQFGPFLGEAVFWVTFIFFLVIAVHVLQFKYLSTFLQNALNNLPHLTIGVVIIFASFLIGSICRQLVSKALMAMKVEQAELLGSAAKGVVIFMGVLLGVAQIGIDISILTTVVAICLGSILGAAALAFGIGSKNYVANILASVQIRKIYQNGDTIMIEHIKGRISEITSTMIILQAAEGQFSMPAKLFLEKTTLLLELKDKDES